MTTNISKLKKAKGIPPKSECQFDVINNDNRTGSIQLKPLQVRIPKDIFEEFSEHAGKEFGFSHGAKKKMFLKIWLEYYSNKTG